MYRCESWTIKKAGYQRTDGFELWFWRKLLRVPWTARRSNHLVLCCPLLLILPSIFPSTRFFSNESVLRSRWPKYWSLTFSISPSNEYSGLISFRLTGLISLLSKGLSGVFSNTTVQKYQFFGAQSSLWSNSHIHT